MARYGRNNMAYISGIGSFFRIIAFFSDFPCTQDEWQEAQMMEACKHCSSCRVNCPTGAISSERFLLRVERCITFHDEHTDIPFPKLIDPSWHDTLMGCMHCQRVCPENKNSMRWIQRGPEFTEEETVLLLEKVPLEKLPPSASRKLLEFDMTGYLDIFPRNLVIFLNRQNDNP